MDSKDFLIALVKVRGFGRVRLRQLLTKYPDPEEIWNFPVSTWGELGIPRNVLDSLQQIKNQNIFGRSQSLLSKGIKITAWGDPDYPILLRESYDPPVLLYYKGDLGCLSQKSIAVVGSRKMTNYGRQVTEYLVEDLAALGMTIVSGLAQGVDTLAHQCALANHAPTVAVLGGGLFNIFPAENCQLAEDIIKDGGAIISEYPPEMEPLPGLFPARNRIIAGLSEAVLVTEAAIGSGSLITASEALNENREVFAVPGPITTQSSLGCLLLIKQGATLVSRIEDILEGLQISPISDRHIEALELTEAEEQIVKLLRLEQKHIDQLIQESGQTLSQIASILLKLELKGVISNLSPGMYVATMKT